MEHKLFKYCRRNT